MKNYEWRLAFVMHDLHMLWQELQHTTAPPQQQLEQQWHRRVAITSNATIRRPSEVAVKLAQI